MIRRLTRRDDRGRLLQYDSTFKASKAIGMPPVFEALLRDGGTTTGHTLTNTGVTYANDATLGQNVAIFNGSAILSSTFKYLPTTNQGFTLSLWMKSDSVVTVDVGILSFGATSQGCMFAPALAADNKITVAGHTSGYGMSGAATFTQTNWNHILITHIPETNGCKIYINGTLSFTGSFVTAMGGIGGFYIGSYWGNAQYIPNFTGRMSTLRIYNYVVTSSQIAELASEF